MLSRLMLETMREAERDAGLRERLGALMDRYRQLLVDAVRADQQRGALIADLDPSAIGTLLGAVGDGLLMHALLDPDLDIAATLQALRRLLSAPVLAVGTFRATRHGGSALGDTVTTISDLLHEAAETHHQVYRITDGTDEDWASWYSDRLTRLSELPDLVARRPVRSELTHHDLLYDPAIGRATMMGYPCVRLAGRLVASYDTKLGGLVVKLPRERILRLVEDGTGEPFAPAGKVFREWMSIPTVDRTLWQTLLAEAVDFARKGLAE